MSRIFTIPVVPLETLPGWPVAPQLSSLELLAGIIGAPLAIIAIIALITYAPALARSGKGKGVTKLPLWLGADFSPELANQNKTMKSSGGGQPATRQAVTVLEEPEVSFSEAEIADFERALTEAEDRSGMRFSLFVGSPDSSASEFAATVIAGQRHPYDTVALIIDPTSRAVEVATGREAARRISSQDCALAAHAVQRAAEDDALASGIVDALNLLGGAGRALPIRNQPEEFQPLR